MRLREVAGTRLRLSPYRRLTYIYACGIYTAVIKIRLNKLLDERGKTMYWLAKETGIRYATIFNLTKGKTDRLKIETLDRICDVLDCKPGDVLVRVNDKDTRR